MNNWYFDCLQWRGRSIHTVVAHLHDAIFNTHRERRHRFIRRRRQSLAGFYIETRPVSGTFDLTAFDLAPRKHTPIVGTDVLDGAESAFAVDNGDLDVV